MAILCDKNTKLIVQGMGNMGNLMKQAQKMQEQMPPQQQ